MRVAVVGPGAIGLTFGAAAAQAGHELVVCARRALPERIVVTRTDAASVEAAAAVLLDPVAAPAEVDLVLVAVKAHQTAGAAGWLARLCGPSTVVAVLQNGVEQRALVEPLARGAEVVPCVVWCPASLEAPGRVTVHGPARLVTEDGAAGQRLAGALAGSFAVVEQRDPAELRLELWRKLIVNAVAGLMALSGADGPTMFTREDVRAVGLAMARECVAVGQAEGVALDATEADAAVAWVGSTPPGSTTSIAVDRANDRELEWDARNGAIVRLGRRHGIPTPVSDIVCALLAAASDAAGTRG
jgi:2-dehydropantoate 2-reductase